MKFNSKSVTLNRGVNVKVNVALPPKLETYTIPQDVWEESIKQFNKELDERSQVSELIQGIKVDVLRVNRTMGCVVLWMTAKEKDVDTINLLEFKLSGKVVFEDEKSDKIEMVLIKDLLYGSPSGEHRSIFRKKKLTS
jgi:hypothetical protein